MTITTTERLDDAMLVAAARDGSRGIVPVATIETIGALATRERVEDTIRRMAIELLEQRRHDRLDSRRSGQLKKLRQSVESIFASIMMKLGEIERGDTPDALASKEPPWLRDAAIALGAIAPDGSALALNWTQVLHQITDQRIRLAALERTVEAFAKGK